MHEVTSFNKALFCFAIRFVIGVYTWNNFIEISKHNFASYKHAHNSDHFNFLLKTITVLCVYTTYYNESKYILIANKSLWSWFHQRAENVSFFSLIANINFGTMGILSISSFYVFHNLKDMFLSDDIKLINL